MEKWIPINPEDGNTGSSASIQKTYGLDGNQYPRLTLAIRTYDEGVNIGCNVKVSEDDWWTNEVVPAMLIDDLVSMLEKSKNETN